jgi:hypothetical protein
MSDLDDIMGSLAKKFSGNMLDDETKKKEVVPPARTTDSFARSSPREYSSYSGSSTSSGNYGGSYANGPKIFPSERMALRSPGSDIIMPKRPRYLISTLPEDELMFMISTPCKRHWEFRDWLEVAGFPVDLHEKYDYTSYPTIARAFLKRKEECHRGR